MAQPNILIVCPTSHMDWDWISSFEEYYKTTSSTPGTGPVQQILDAALSLFQTESSFVFNLAEIGWLQRYLVDQGGSLPSAPNLSLMGGGITSPDNVVCDGEVFVRTYLVGRQWAQSVGLEGAIANVSWMPDDFGHDPELPVILSAMGLSAVAFARVPGAFPNFNGPLDTTPSMACALMAQGVAFNWQAGDGSLVFAHFMPNTYLVPWYSLGNQGNADYWRAFVQSKFLTPVPPAHGYSCSSLPEVVWPGGIAFAPAGGDFSVPDSGWVGGVAQLNQQQTVTTASIGTFPDYVSAVQKSGASLTSMQLDPSNFWTGLFGSRPALKILQAIASRDLVAAEAVSNLLRLGAVTSSSALDAVDGAIGQVWDILAPSSHHDFVTGTSPDRTYKMEQLPMLSLAANLARLVYRRALQIIADSIVLSGEGTVVAVHNAVGLARDGIFKLDHGSAVSFPTSGAATVQPLANGGLLIQSPVVPSLGYTSGLVTFGARTSPREPVVVSDAVTIDNGTIAITLSQDQAWAITSITLGGGANLLPGGEAANLLKIYDDTGNLYQYGNEPGAGPPSNPNAGTFGPSKRTLTGSKAVQTEFGPLRWRVEAEVIGTDGSKYGIVYTLIIGESLVRMTVTGSAPENSTVVTTFPAIANDGTTEGTHLIYGTAHHFHEDAAPAYWEGPTFKATHDFLMPAADNATFSLAAIYHRGMPAWACNQGTLLGSLFRNTDGQQRGAAGTDSDPHTQRYALRISATALDPTQGTPLVEALGVTTPLRAALASAANGPEGPVTLLPTASLASTEWSLASTQPAIVRVTRPMGEVKSAACISPLAQVALRIYRPDADGTPSSVQLTMPVLTAASSAKAALVTALEQPIGNAPVTVNNNILGVPASFAVTTVAVTATRPVTTPTDGKGNDSGTCAQ